VAGIFSGYLKKDLAWYLFLFDRQETTIYSVTYGSNSRSKGTFPFVDTIALL